VKDGTGRIVSVPRSKIAAESVGTAGTLNDALERAQRCSTASESGPPGSRSPACARPCRRRAGGERDASRAVRPPGGDGLALQPAETPHARHAHTYWYPNGLSDQTDTSDGGPPLPNAVWATVDSTAGALAGDVPSPARWGRELLGGHILRPASLNEMTRFHGGAFWQGYGLGPARYSFQGRDTWGHTGDGGGSHTELRYFPHERLTVAVSWNDDVIDRDDAP
jgi:hypothetical protein